jgi:uncharacterized phage infection (PIP) family protein YhgE
MLKLKDALQERSLIDRWGFVAFATVGGAIIWLFKAKSSLSVEAIAATAVLLMGAYAWMVSARGTGKLRADQAGDNCYYLGLIYTLISLSHAIFTFDPANTATTIVQGFGIALISTIFGLMLRVFFNQSRVDLYEVEDSARLELAEAAGRLKTQLSQIANNFRDFAFGIQQSMDELRQSASESIGQAANESVRAIKELAAATSEGLKGETTILTERVAELSKATNKTVSAIEKHAATLDGLTNQQASATETLRLIESSVASAAAVSEQMRSGLETASASQATMQSSANQLVDSISKLRDSVGGSLTTLQSLHSEFQDRLQKLEKAPQATLDAALSAIAGAADRLKSAIESLASQHEGAGKSIEALSSGVVQSLHSHNAELEAELSRSRENVAKVHGALVEMTTSLADQIEQRAAK